MRLLVGHAHQPAVDLIGLEQVVAAELVLVAHGNPAIGDDGVGALGGLEGVGGHRDLRPLVSSPRTKAPGAGRVPAARRS